MGYRITVKPATRGNAIAEVTATDPHHNEIGVGLTEQGVVILIEDLVKTLPADSTVREAFAARFGL